VSHRRRDAGLRGGPAAIPLSRLAPRTDAAQYRAAAPRDARDSQVSRLAGILGDRDADSDEVDPRGRPRLPRREPRARRRVPRASAVAADLQTDPDDLGNGPLLPDRALLSRRGPACVPTA